MLFANRVIAAAAACYALLALSRNGALAQRPDSEDNVPVTLTLKAPNLFPEAIEYYANKDKFVVTSTFKGTVHFVDPVTGALELKFDSATVPRTGPFAILPPGPLNMLGIQLEKPAPGMYPGSKTVGHIACPFGLARNDTPVINFLLTIDIEKGTLLRAVKISGDTPQPPELVNDVVPDAQGNVFVTDTFAKKIYRVASPKENNAVTVFASGDQLPGPVVLADVPFNVNGLEYFPTGNFLVIASINQGGLFKCAIDATGALAGGTCAFIPMQGPCVDPSTCGPTGQLIFGDGLIRRGETELYISTGSPTDRLYLVSSFDQWATAKVEQIALVGATSSSVATVALRKGRPHVIAGFVGEGAGGLERQEFFIHRVM